MDIENIAKQAGMASYEIGIYEGDISDLEKFAKIVIDNYEAEDSFTTYGRKEDWE